MGAGGIVIMYTVITIHTSFQMCRVWNNPDEKKQKATQFINLITSKFRFYEETEAHLVGTKENSHHLKPLG